MKVGVIATTNQKGQIVIPAAFRNQLGITDQIPLHITIQGNIIQIVPIKDIVTMENQTHHYLDILKKTQGSWQGDPDISAQKTNLEHQASVKRKQSW